MLAIILENPTDRLLSALRISSFKDFRLYVPETFKSIPNGDDLNFTTGNLAKVTEDYVMYLSPWADPGSNVLKKLASTIKENPEFDVYHINIEGGGSFPVTANAEKAFVYFAKRKALAPLSAFVFRTSALKEKIVYRQDGSMDHLATVISCIDRGFMRTVRFTSMNFLKPDISPKQEEEMILRRIEFLRWSEGYFIGSNYPISVPVSLSIFAKEVASLYPSRDFNELKEMMLRFKMVNGPIRKMLATSALKNAVKSRAVSSGSQPLRKPVEDEENPAV